MFHTGVGVCEKEQRECWGEDQTRLNHMAYPVGYSGHLLSEVTCMSEWGSTYLFMTDQKNLEYSQTTKDFHQACWSLVLQFQSLVILGPSILRLTPRPGSCWSPFPLQACHTVLGGHGESELRYWRAVQTRGLSPGLSVCPSAIETWGASVGSFSQTYGCHLGSKQMWDILHLFLRIHLRRGHKTLGQGLSDLNPNLLAPSGQVTEVGVHVHPLTRLSFWCQ